MTDELKTVLEFGQLQGRQPVQDEGDLRGPGDRAGPHPLRVDAGEGITGAPSSCVGNYNSSSWYAP